MKLLRYFSSCFLFLTLMGLSLTSLAGWEKMPGSATDIGIGGNGIWIAGTEPVDGGYRIYRWSHNDWRAEEGGAVAISVGSNGEPWVVNRQGDIFYRQGIWQKLPGAAHDIGVGGNGNTWVIGVDSTSGGYQIFHWSGSNWDMVDGGAVRIAVDPYGNPWVVNNEGSIFRYVNGNWQTLPGKGTDIAVGSNGAAWLIGTDRRPGGYGIYRWTGGNWENVDGGAVRIAVDAGGTPWVVNDSGDIFKLNADHRRSKHTVFKIRF